MVAGQPPHSRGRDHGGAVADRITWYDIIGITPGASAETVRHAHQAKAKQLQSYRIAGAPPEVANAAARGQKAIGAAWPILRNPAQREQYDQQIGAVRKGAGLATTNPVAARLVPPAAPRCRAG